MTTKVTKQATHDFVKTQLSKNQTWALRALLKIYEFQTYEEKQYEATTEYNGVGFTGVDAEILTSFAKQYKSRGFLSPKQMVILYKKMPKYWGQIVKISNEEQLKLQVAKYLVS